MTLFTLGKASVNDYTSPVRLFTCVGRYFGDIANQGMSVLRLPLILSLISRDRDTCVGAKQDICLEWTVLHIPKITLNSRAICGHVYGSWYIRNQANRFARRHEPCSEMCESAVMGRKNYL